MMCAHVTAPRAAAVCGCCVWLGRAAPGAPAVMLGVHYLYTSAVVPTALASPCTPGVMPVSHRVHLLHSSLRTVTPPILSKRLAGFLNFLAPLRLPGLIAVLPPRTREECLARAGMTGSSRTYRCPWGRSTQTCCNNTRMLRHRTTQPAYSEWPSQCLACHCYPLSDTTDIK